MSDAFERVDIFLEGGFRWDIFLDFLRVPAAGVTPSKSDERSRKVCRRGIKSAFSLSTCIWPNLSSKMASKVAGSTESQESSKEIHIHYWLIINYKVSA